MGNTIVNRNTQSQHSIATLNCDRRDQQKIRVALISFKRFQSLRKKSSESSDHNATSVTIYGPTPSREYTMLTKILFRASVSRRSDSWNQTVRFPGATAGSAAWFDLRP